MLQDTLPKAAVDRFLVFICYLDAMSFDLAEALPDLRLETAKLQVDDSQQLKRPETLFFSL
jgi:hypothetical protein